jgi:hypothetical protein
VSDPSLELQKAIVARLKADSATAAIVGARIYDEVPTSAAFPYINLGEDQTIAERADCYDGSEINLTLHAWSREPGYPEVKRIADAVRASLQDAPLTLTGHRLVDLTFIDSRVLRDPDGKTSHAVVTLRALTEPV